MNFKSKKKFISFILLFSLIFSQVTIVQASSDNIYPETITEEEFTQKVIDTINEYSTDFNEDASQLSGPVGDIIKDILSGVVEGLNFDKLFDRIMQSVDAGFKEIVDGIRYTITGIVDSISDDVGKTIVGSIDSIGENIRDTIVGSIEVIGDDVSDSYKHTINKIIDDGIRNLADNIGKLTNDFLNGLFKGPISGIGQGIGESIKSIMEGLKVGVDAGIIQIDQSDSENKTNDKFELLQKEIIITKQKLDALLKETLENEDLTDKEKVEVVTSITGVNELLSEYLKVVNENLNDLTSEISNLDEILAALSTPKKEGTDDTGKDKPNDNDNAITETLNVKTSRIAGDDRYETSVKAAREAYPNGVNTIILASGENYADALSASSLTAQYDAPIVLTDGQKLPTLVKTYIESNSLKKLYIVGGTDSISKNIEDQLKSINIDVERLAGINRYETSYKIVSKIVGEKSINDIIFVNGYNFADALAASSASANFNIPILLTNGLSLDKVAKDYLAPKDIEKLYIVGGTESVSNNVKNDLRFEDVERINGSNRVATSIAVANKFFPDNKEIIVTSGDLFPDALSASAVSKVKKAPIILNTGNNVNRNLINFIKEKDINNITIVGGPDSVPVSLEAISK